MLYEALVELHEALDHADRWLPAGETPSEKIAHLALGMMRDAEKMLHAALDVEAPI